MHPWPGVSAAVTLLLLHRKNKCCKNNTPARFFIARPPPLLSRVTPPNTYYLIEGNDVGDALILHKLDDNMIDVVLTNGSDLFIQLWMVRCDSLAAGTQ